MNQAIAAGGESYFRYRQIDLPMIAPKIAEALAEARLITISGSENGGAPIGATNQIASVIQTVLAAQLVSKGGILGDMGNGVVSLSLSLSLSLSRTDVARSHRGAPAEFDDAEVGIP